MDTKVESSKLEPEAQPVIPATVETAPAPDTKPTPAAAEIETPQSPGILARISTAISRALALGPKRSGHALTMAMLIDAAGGQDTFTLPSEIAKLTAWQARHDANLKFMLSANSDMDWLTHVKDLQKRIEDGSHGEVSARSREQFFQAHAEKVDAARRNLEEIYQECFPLCNRIAARAIEVAERQTAAREKTERDQHAHYGVPYDGPSNIVRHFRAAIQYARMRSTFVRYGGRSSPMEIIGYINF